MSRPTLTENQRRAVLNQATRSYVEAAPGSGKTTIAVERHGVLHHRRTSCDPRGILSVTYTRSAASELRQRISERWGSHALSPLNRVMTIDGLHRSVVEFLLTTGKVRWPGGVTSLSPIDSWARQRGATLLMPSTKRDKRWEFKLRERALSATYRRVNLPCWGMHYSKRQHWMEQIENGICSHDEIRQVVSLSLSDIELRNEIAQYLTRTYQHLIVDEVFDANPLDALLIRTCLEVDIDTTLVGDPWQALYQWRGANPKLIHTLLTKYNFHSYPTPESFRFRTPETTQLSERLRAGHPVKLPISADRPDVVLAGEWSHLTACGADVIPLSFGRLDCQTDAALILLLDVVTRARLRLSALGIHEATRCLRRDLGEVDLSAATAALHDLRNPLEECMRKLRFATKVDNRIPALPRDRQKAQTRFRRLELLRRWLTIECSYSPGLTFHQAKGREWPSVDLALTRASISSLASGLTPEKEAHRKLYVGATRGIYSTRLRNLDD